MITAPPSLDPEPRWNENLAAGAPGIILRHIMYARAGRGEWASARQWAAAMLRSPVTADPADCGLFRGAPAVAFALHSAGQGAAQAMATLDTTVDTLTSQRLERAYQRLDAGRLPELREWDLISGLTGIGVYLLHRYGGGNLLRDVLAYLVRLTEPVKDEGELLPGWWSRNGPADRPDHRWPGGHGNIGMAHGIAGPLALLSTAMRHNVVVGGQPEAVERVCAWLDLWVCDSSVHRWWPGMISLPEWRAGGVRQRGPQRPSWCYGTPGLARAQQLAALALGDTMRQRAAQDTLAQCVSDPAQLDQLTDLSLCHGLAGVVQTVRRSAADSDDGRLCDQLPRLTALLDRVALDGPSLEGSGLLEGTAGLDLAQLATAATSAAPHTWDTCLLLAG
ncbi:lanthionine synthetase C family protein [Kitasatospora kifunensis]|uniref:Lanthionine synthetase n=1 Tax=Kitasatospora kifunensis TaxID=58351 RepID=A0A7W7VY14_KITKI|nr:lanthionine synthetase C family protein [Kitasatospora kifunensis]MBB4926204.1 hypothetical protein [Kitasatospora kifunensis]